MKITKQQEGQIGDFVRLVTEVLLEDLLGGVTEKKEKTPCSFSGEGIKNETLSLDKVWYLVVDNENEFDGIVHKTSKALDIRDFKGKTIEVFDNYSEANKRRNQLLEEDMYL